MALQSLLKRISLLCNFWIALTHILESETAKETRPRANLMGKGLGRELFDKSNTIILLRGAMRDDSDGGLMEKLIVGSFLHRDESMLLASNPLEGRSTTLQKKLKDL